MLSTYVILTMQLCTSFLMIKEGEGRVQAFGKRCQSAKRDPNCPVVIRGWLNKKDSRGLKLWKRRWFVLSNYCFNKSPERSLCSAASRCQATKSSSAHHKNAKTKSSPSRYIVLLLLYFSVNYSEV
uniref:PH domain-containing protein n=1 Tax=Cynoglossus semilaevis TaxID=244447 RepID=A0A3P8V9A8_CYNSE